METTNFSHNNTTFTDRFLKMRKKMFVNGATGGNEGSKNTFYNAKLGRKWVFTSPASSHIRGPKIFNKKPGPKVQVQNEIEAFELFATEDYEPYK